MVTKTLTTWLEDCDFQPPDFPGRRGGLEIEVNPSANHLINSAFVMKTLATEAQWSSSLVGEDTQCSGRVMHHNSREKEHGTSVSKAFAALAYKYRT